MKFRKKPVVIEAMLWDGEFETWMEICSWVASFQELTDWTGSTHVSWDPTTNELFIPTLEGTMTASKGDWIIRGVQNEIYPCKPDIFEQTYESAE